MNWVEISVLVPVEYVEAVAAIFWELGLGGVVIEDPTLILKYASLAKEDEWAIMSPGKIAKNEARIKAYLTVDDRTPEILLNLKSDLSCLPMDRDAVVHTCVIVEQDWANSWKSYYRTMRVGRRLVIKPAWAEFCANVDDLVIDLDPGMAFGCGTHPTTLFCLHYLEKYVKKGLKVYDVGTGSGILAIASVLLGAEKVVAVDNDPLACRIATENALRNKVDDRILVCQGELASQFYEQADLIVANIVADVIIKLAPESSRLLVRGGIFICSGIIKHRADEVAGIIGENGLVILEKKEDGQWVALVAQKIDSVNN